MSEGVDSCCVEGGEKTIKGIAHCYIGDMPRKDVEFEWPESIWLKGLEQIERGREIVPLDLEGHSPKKEGLLFEAYIGALGGFNTPRGVELIRKYIFENVPLPESIEEWRRYGTKRTEWLSGKMKEKGVKFSHPVQYDVFNFACNLFDVEDMIRSLEELKVDPERVQYAPISPKDYTKRILDKIKSANASYLKLTGEEFFSLEASENELAKYSSLLMPIWLGYDQKALHEPLS